VPGKGHAYQITAEWQQEIRDKLEELGISQNELARLAGIRQSSLSSALKKGAIQSAKMPAINKAAGLPPPLDSTTSAGQEAARLIDQLNDPVEKGKWIEKIRQAVEQQPKRRR
jgi:transcriptional regulator with XRE-family HTH domain